MHERIVIRMEYHRSAKKKTVRETAGRRGCVSSCQGIKGVKDRMLFHNRLLFIVIIIGAVWNKWQSENDRKNDQNQSGNRIGG